MTKTVRVNATLDDDLLERIDAFARERREDRSTAIRQLVDIGLRELSKRDALNAYRQGRLTLREVADVLHLGVWAAHDLLLAEGVAIAQGSWAETSAATQRLVPTVTGRTKSRSTGGARRRESSNQGR
jgi:predicted transcriptional regulator